MRVTILGTGTSTGVPVPGCRCGVCSSSNPKNSRLRTSAYIECDSGLSLLIDAGPDLREQALRNEIGKVDGVLYTHAHADHILGTDDLRVFNFRRREPIPCFGSEETLEALRKTFHYIFEPNPEYQGGLIAKLTLNSITPGTPFDVEGETITPLKLYHGSSTVVGFRIGDFVYATDCNRIPDASLEIMESAEVLVLDALRYEPHRTHFTIPDAVKTAQSLGAKQTYLIHMTHDIDHDEVDSELPEGVSLAFDGLVFEV